MFYKVQYTQKGPVFTCTSAETTSEPASFLHPVLPGACSAVPLCFSFSTSLHVVTSYKTTAKIQNILRNNDEYCQKLSWMAAILPWMSAVSSHGRHCVKSVQKISVFGHFSRSEVFCKKRYSKIFSQISQENTCFGVSFIIRSQALKSFPVQFAKFLRTLNLKNIGEGVLLSLFWFSLFTRSSSSLKVVRLDMDVSIIHHFNISTIQ